MPAASDGLFEEDGVVSRTKDSILLLTKRPVPQKFCIIALEKLGDHLSHNSHPSWLATGKTRPSKFLPLVRRVEPRISP